MDFFYKFYERIRKYFLNDQCYFFLPLIKEYDTSLTLTSIVQNSTKFYKFKNLCARVWFFDNKKNHWVNITNFYFKNKNVLKMYSSDFFKYKKFTNLLLISLDNSIRDKYSKKIPNSFIKKIDFSPHTLRGKHSFIKNNISSGYMGEYPLKMTQVISGNAFSYVNMFHSQPLKSKSTIVFINFSENQNMEGRQNQIRLVQFQWKIKFSLEKKLLYFLLGILVFQFILMNTVLIRKNPYLLNIPTHHLNIFFQTYISTKLFLRTTG